MKKSRIVVLNGREFEIVDVSDDIDVVDEKVKFDREWISKKDVELLIKYKLNDFRRFRVKYEHFKTTNFELESSFENYLDEEENEILDDLDFLVSSLNMLK